MSTPTNSTQSIAGASESAAPPAWGQLLRAHATLTRRMDAALREHHGLNLSEYEVLLQLGKADGGRLRRVDLAQRLLITQGGMTRLLAGLESRGLVRRASCSEDGRVVYAALTSAGRRKLMAARKTHLEDVRRLFSGRFADQELDLLGDFLSRLDDPDRRASTPAPMR